MGNLGGQNHIYPPLYFPGTDPGPERARQVFPKGYLCKSAGPVCLQANRYPVTLHPENRMHAGLRHCILSDAQPGSDPACRGGLKSISIYIQSHCARTSTAQTIGGPFRRIHFVIPSC